MVKGILVNRKSDEMLKNQLKMEHADLVAEMQTVENLPTHERLQLARLRRTQQLKAARQKEKEWMKLQRAKGVAPSLNGSTTHHFRSSLSRHISFENSVVLLEAASRNDMQEVADLLQHGITPDAANEDGLTALHQCCIDNNVEMLKLLLQYGANVDAQDSDKWTPLHAASTCGHLELVRILIEHGANLLSVNTDGNMPYDLCDDENTLDFIEAEMSKRGVTQELIDETRSSTERQMLRDLADIARLGGDLEEPDCQGATPLHIAAANGYTRVVEFLLESHVNVDALDKDLWSPVHAAACWGHLEVLELLAQFGADLNVKNKDDETPSDICEDPEIRERIEQLKTEQESKRLAEAQRRRVRRSQSNNTRAQSVRRTSLRDKTLTTKKDAVEEARLRLQAQEVLIAPDSLTLEPALNGATLSATTNPGNMETNSTNDKTQKKWTALDTNGDIHSSANNSKNQNNNIIYNKEKKFSPSLAFTNGPLVTQTVATPDCIDSLPRRPPDGKETDNEMLPNSSVVGVEQNRIHSSASSAVGASTRHAAAATTSEAWTALGPNKEPANGKINVQVTVLVDTTSTHRHLHNVSQLPQLESSSFSGATLANLKKQRSHLRSCILNENGSVLGAANSTASNAASAASHSNNIPSGESSSVVSLNPALMDFMDVNTNDTNSAFSVNRFSGVTGDVVSDSTRSRKCCTVM